MINGKKILAITLARGGSKSIFKKNIALLAGKPMLGYTVDAAKASRFIDRYIVSTDDTEIADVARQLGVDVPFLRPATLSTDTASSGDALFHAVQTMEEMDKCRYDIIVELMATNPLKTTEQIDQSIAMIAESGADSVIAVTRVLDQHPARIKRIENGRLIDFCIEEPREARRQDLSPAAYIRCGSIYTLDRDFLMRTKHRYGSAHSLALVVDENESANIDSKADFYLAEAMLRERAARTVTAD